VEVREKQIQAAGDELTAFLYGRASSDPMPGPSDRGAAVASDGVRPGPDLVLAEKKGFP
jgi:hypothetical protein